MVYHLIHITNQDASEWQRGLELLIGVKRPAKASAGWIDVFMYLNGLVKVFLCFLFRSSSSISGCLDALF